MLPHETEASTPGRTSKYFLLLENIVYMVAFTHLEIPTWIWFNDTSIVLVDIQKSSRPLEQVASLLGAR